MRHGRQSGHELVHSTQRVVSGHNLSPHAVACFEEPIGLIAVEARVV